MFTLENTDTQERMVFTLAEAKAMPVPGIEKVCQELQSGRVRVYESELGRLRLRREI